MSYTAYWSRSEARTVAHSIERDDKVLLLTVNFAEFSGDRGGLIRLGEGV